MKKNLALIFLGIILIQSFSWTNTLESQQEELKKILTLRFKYENLKNIRENYEKELNVLELQYERNKKIEDFQKKQPEEEIKTPVYTTVFNFIPTAIWEDNFIKYADTIKLTEVPRRSTTELIFNFPSISSKIKNQLSTYKTQMPIVTVTSVLLASGKLLEINKVVSPKIDEQSITVPTEGASIVKVNLSMSYFLPIEQNSKTILSRETPKLNDMELLPSFKNVAMIELEATKADTIIQIDAVDVKGNYLATRTTERISNTNDLSTQAIRIDLLRNFLKAIDDRDIKTPQDALDFLLKNSDAYLIAFNKSTRHLSKSFAGNIEQIIVYTIDGTTEKKHDFSIYP